MAGIHYSNSYYAITYLQQNENMDSKKKGGVWSRRMSCLIAILLLSFESLFCLVREMSQGDSSQ